MHYISGISKQVLDIILSLRRRGEGGGLVDGLMNLPRAPNVIVTPLTYALCNLLVSVNKTARFSNIGIGHQSIKYCWYLH